MALNKTVMRLDINGCYKCKKVALHSVTKIEGIDSLSINMKDSTLTVIGEADSVTVANMLRRKFRCAELVYGGLVPPPPPPPKEKPPEKKDPPKEEKPTPEKKDPPKEEKPKEPEKKEEKPKEEEKKEEKPKEEPKKEEKPKEVEKTEEKPKEEPKPEKKEEVTVQPAHSPCPMYKVCDAQCYPPCSTCSSRPEIMWPRYQHPGSAPNEVWYVWNEEKQESCTIM